MSLFLHLLRDTKTSSWKMNPDSPCKLQALKLAVNSLIFSKHREFNVWKFTSSATHTLKRGLPILEFRIEPANELQTSWKR